MKDMTTIPSYTEGKSNGSKNIGTEPTLPDNLASVDVAAPSSGITSKYWVELVAYPSGSARSLWLFVNNTWVRLDNPNSNISDVVQRAFLNTGSNVRVWYDAGKIVGLVVEGN